jgi:glucokinase
VADPKHVIGVDVGGTKILAAVVDEIGNVGKHVERPTELASQKGLIDEFVAVVEELRDDSIDGVGLGLPSRLDSKAGHVEASVNIPLENVDLRAELEARFGIPVALENDGNAAALAEFTAGVGVEATTLVMLTLGTGVGGGVVIEGRLLPDAAELGHVVIDYDGIPCQGTCTGRGHLEAYASGTAATKRAREAFGPDADAHRLVSLAREGNETALELLADIGGRLGAAIGSFVNTFGPQLVVIGGGFAAAGDLLLVPAEEIMRREALPPWRDRVRIVRAELGARAGVIGAGLVAVEALAAS